MIETAEIVAAFDRQTRSSLGAEEELMLLSPRDGDLVPEVERALATLGSDDRFKRELPASQVESMTTPCATVEELADQLLRARSDLAAALDGSIDLAAAGTHPYAAVTGPLNRGARYDAAAADFGTAALSRQLVFALQIHVAPGDAHTALAVYNALRSYLPEIAAVAANAPFHGGVDTGLASVRPGVASLLPRQGIPPSLASWDDYAHALRSARIGSSPAGPGSWWWELRPHPVFGTLELRVPDAQTTVADAAAIAALGQCLVTWLSERHRQGERLSVHPTLPIVENSRRAARDGVGAVLVDLDCGEPTPVRDSVNRLLGELEEVATDLGCAPQLALIPTLLERNGAIRQREIAAEQDLGGLVAWLISRFLVAPTSAGGPAAVVESALPPE
jgi:glutamate---cysteine ligase / carboxylate-amine ligase